MQISPYLLKVDCWDLFLSRARKYDDIYCGDEINCLLIEI